MNTEPKLSLYTSHDRELLFHGTVDEARAIGWRLQSSTWTVTLNGGPRRKILNQVIWPDGATQLWIAS
jgi:hypothetical protein